MYKNANVLLDAKYFLIFVSKLLASRRKSLKEYEKFLLLYYSEFK